MYNMNNVLVCGLLALASLGQGLLLVEGVDLDRLVIVVVSQPNKFHTRIAEHSEKLLWEQFQAKGAPHSKILLTHRDQEVGSHGSWTFFPILKRVGTLYAGQFDHVIILEENSNVNLSKLVDLLHELDPKDPHFLGYALKDSEPVIIHHYDSPGMKYPLGPMILSSGLVEIFLRNFETKKKEKDVFPENFSIDSYYELAKFLSHLEDNQSNGIFLRHHKEICPDNTESESCAIYPRSTLCSNSTKEELIDLAKKTLFAVKTCEKYHESRLPVIKDTWYLAALNIVLISETEDAKFGTRTLPNVRNTEQGHCRKTEAIIEYFNQNADVNGWTWLVIADDDTILSPRKMMEILKCYDEKDLVHLGQRYGFGIANGEHGYDYITGGGGMVFTRALTKKMLEEHRNYCSCPKDDHPDDMHFGACLASLGIPLVHSPKFHQARPEDYSPELIKSQDPISFHKFWNTDPRSTYQKYFLDSDLLLVEKKKNHDKILHHEL